MCQNNTTVQYGKAGPCGKTLDCRRQPRRVSKCLSLRNGSVITGPGLIFSLLLMPAYPSAFQNELKQYKALSRCNLDLLHPSPNVSLKAPSSCITQSLVFCYSTGKLVSGPTGSQRVSSYTGDHQRSPTGIYHPVRTFHGLYVSKPSTRSIFNLHSDVTVHLKLDSVILRIPWLPTGSTGCPPQSSGWGWRCLLMSRLPPRCYLCLNEQLK